jgi:hypothetical protein
LANADGQPPFYKLNVIQNGTGGESLPNNIIAAWTGTTANIPAGWIPCNGSGACPNLNDKFIKGANANGEIGATGGALTHTHVAGAAHNHTINVHQHTFSTASQATNVLSSGSTANSNTTAHTHTATISNPAQGGTTGTQTITADANTNNRPPYMEVVYIMLTVVSPTVTTQDATNIGTTTATGNGNITDTGSASVTAWGVCYKTSSGCTTGDTVAAGSGAGGIGPFTASLVNLTPGATYHVRAYATSSAGTSYGSEMDFNAAAISISLTTDGSVGFGTVVLGSTKNSGPSGFNHPETVSIDGGPATLRIKSSNFTEGGNTWTLSNGSGANLVKWEYSKDGTNWTTFDSPDPTDYSFDTNVAQGQTRNIYLKITMPSSTASYNQYNSSVTIVASAP